MNKAIAIVTSLRDPGQHSLQAIQINCSECSYVIFTAVPARLVETAGELIDIHLEQHEPGRALDIEIDWILSADCSVCDDGGDIDIMDSESVQCDECGTTWTIDGTDGELNE